MESYSQYGQDKFIYENFFKTCARPGFFVDIGAYDGITCSNTLMFERHLGWKGICIEPHPGAFAKMKKFRTAICVNCAVSETPGKAKFLDVKMPNAWAMFSGLKENYDERHMHLIDTLGKITAEIEVEVRRLSYILDKNKIRHIDYMSIDTEGSEWKILQGFDFAKYDVSVLSIENNYHDMNIRKHMVDNGYQLINIFGGIDDLYIKLKLDRAAARP